MYLLSIGTDGFVYRMYLGLHEGYSYLVPLYWRYKYEGRATNHLMFPLYAAITRNVVRQPIGGEFAFNAKMLCRFTDTWSKDWRNFGVDIGMTITAGTCGETIGQVVLPRKINYVGRDARLQIGDMFIEVGRSLFNGLLDFLECHDHDWEPKPVTLAPVVEIEAVQDNNAKIELSDSTEVLGALHQFFLLYNSTGFQNDSKEVLGNMCDRITNVYEELHNLCSIQHLANLKAMNHESKGTIIRKVQCSKSVFLSAREWAEIVCKCLNDFQIRRKNNEDKASTVVLRNVLLCVFYLRVFSFNVQTYNLPSYPDAEDLLTQQMREFSKVVSTKLFQRQ